MQFIFCASPMDTGKADELYAPEVEAVRYLGGNVSLINFEALVDDNDPVKAVRNVRQAEDEVDFAIYRGWMLSPAKYEQFYEALRERGVELINDPGSYRALPLSA